MIITRSSGMDCNQVPRGPDAPRSLGKVTKAARDATSDPIPRVMRSLSRCGLSLSARPAPHSCHPQSGTFWGAWLLTVGPSRHRMIFVVLSGWGEAQPDVNYL